MRLILLFLLLLSSIIMSAQVHESKNWCRINCDPNINTENAELVYKFIQLDSVQNALRVFKPKRFPVRFVYVSSVHKTLPSTTKSEIDEVIRNLNNSYQKANFKFYLENIELLNSELKLEDLSDNVANIYNEFSHTNDKEDVITIYVMEYKSDFCTATDRSISCSKVGGFSYILSDLTNNIVLSEFDLREPRIVAHEFGHFFGLYHTFEQALFGKDEFSNEDCYVVGDRLCDTPPDPGTVYEVHVNYSRCEMVGLDGNDGNSYHPKIDNYMSYYKPCYLKPYNFTAEQVMIMQLSSELPLRTKFSRG